ncbi:MAG TPA: transcription antitermination factor NusB [Actinomycetota bacterium]|jgi:N utilization substance protein B
MGHASALGPGEEHRPHRRIGHRKRRNARRSAIDILYQADVTERDPLEVMEEWRRAGRTVHEYTEELVRGVEERVRDIDRVLGENAEEWTVPRMAAVDRAILRVASYELSAGIPPAVAINEAVEAAKDLSTEDSGRFINGVLGRIVARSAEAEGAGPT